MRSGPRHPVGCILTEKTHCEDAARFRGERAFGQVGEAVSQLGQQTGSSAARAM